MRRRRLVSWRSCVGKTRYRTFRVARWSATFRSAMSGDAINAYRCLICRRFHIGHGDAIGEPRRKKHYFD